MAIVNVLGESALRSLILALAVAAVLGLLRVENVRIAKRAWTAVLVLALAMPALVALRIPSFSFTAVWATPRVLIAPSASPAEHALLPTSFAPSTQDADTWIAPFTLAVPVPLALRGAAAPSLGIPWSHIPWSRMGLVAYIAISVLMLFRILAGLVLAARLWRRAQIFATSETDLPVRLTAELHSPVTLAHGILLPLEAIAWDDATLRTTLAHEQAHVREGDFYLQLAAALHLCFFWISPLAWWLRPQLARLSETICDRAAVETTGDGLGYAQLLLRFATTERVSAGMVAMAQSGGLRERVERLIADPQLANAFRQRRGQALSAALLLGVAAVATAATVHVLQPEAVVLASPQAPAPPAVPPVAPKPATEVAPTSEVLPAPVPPVPDVAVAPEAAPAPTPPADTVGLPVPPEPPDTVVVSGRHAVVHVDPNIISVHSDIATDVHTRVLAMPQLEIVSPMDSDSRGYAIYGPDGDRTVMMHGWFGDSDKLHDEHAQHPGGAVLFRRDGKSWIIDDPALVKQAQEAYAPVQNLGKRQGELGEKQGVLGEQQGQFGELQGALGEKQGEWGARQGELAKDFKFEMPQGFDESVKKLTESATRLAMERDSLSASQLAALEAQHKEAQANFDKMTAQIKAQEPQREAWAEQMREEGERMRKEMEPLMKQMQELGAKQGQLGKLQAELGHQQSLLGEQQRKASREANQRVQSLIDQAVRDGKAHPAQ